MTLITAQLMEDAEQWAALSFTDGGSRLVPPIWPMAPISLEAENFTSEAVLIHVLQARDLGRADNNGGINAFKNAIFNQTAPSSDYAGVLYRAYSVPAWGTLRETISPSLPWLAIWTEADEYNFALRAVSLGGFGRGPSRLALAPAPEYGHAQNN